MRKLTTTGDLRSVLMETIQNVQNGKLEAQKALSIMKLASQINTSLLAEAQIAKLYFMANKDVFTIGSMPLEGGTILMPVPEKTRIG